MKSSLPTIGSAKRWEVVGNIRIINVISFGYIVVILFCLAVFSRLGRQCKPPRLDLSETLHQFEFGTVMKVFFAILLPTSSCHHCHNRAVGSLSRFSSMVNPWSCIVLQHVEYLRPDPAFSPRHMSLLSNLAQWLTCWATSSFIGYEACLTPLAVGSNTWYAKRFGWLRYNEVSLKNGDIFYCRTSVFLLMFDFCLDYMVRPLGDVSVRSASRRWVTSERSSIFHDWVFIVSSPRDPTKLSSNFINAFSQISFSGHVWCATIGFH